MRNINLDIMKMVFAIIVVISHLHYFDETLFFANYGSLAVDFFFIVTGYLCVNKVMGSTKEYSPRDTLYFIKGKLFIVLPVLIVAAIVAFTLSSIVYITTNGYDAWQFIENLFTEINEILCLEMAGIPAYAAVDVDWYISAMIIGLLILHPLVAKYREKFTTVWALVIGLLILGFLFGRTGSLLAPRAWIVFTYKGLLRGIADMCLGMFSYTVVQKIKSIDFTVLGRSILTFLELACFILSITFLLVYEKSNLGNSTLESTVILMIFVAFTIMMSGKSYTGIPADSSVLQKISNSLGKLSLYLYLSHNCWIFSVKTIFPDASIETQLLICAVGTVATMIACHFGSKLLIIIWNILKEKSVKTSNIDS